MEVDFDSWPDYTPVGDSDLKVEEVINPNLVKLKREDNPILLEISEGDYYEVFDYNSEEDYSGNVFLRFLKSEDIEDLTLFDSPKNEDIFLIKKGEKLYFLNVYECKSYYRDNNKLTFVGWDYNLVINIKTMKSEIFYTR